MLQSIHDQMTDFYDSIEEEYATFFGDHFDWEHVHFKFLIYYLVRYGSRLALFRHSSVGSSA